MNNDCAVCDGNDDPCDRHKRESRGDPVHPGQDVTET